jgi:hypothetical protein
MHDIINGTNRYQLPFLVFSTVDANRNLKAVAQAILPDETTASHSWALSQFIECMGNMDGVVILTDYDPAIGAALEDELPDAVHLLCRWHQSECIAKNCRARIGSEFEQFKSQFLKVRDELSVEAFESGWVNLLANYPMVSSYMRGTWYQVRCKWASAWTQKRFTAGMKTTSGAESINAIIRKMLKANTNTSLVQLFQSFDAHFGSQVVENHTNQAMGQPGPSFRVAFQQFEEPLELLRRFCAPKSFNEALELCNHALSFRVKQCSEQEIEQEIGVRRLNAFRKWIDASQEIFALQSVLSARNTAEVLVVVLPDHSTLCSCMRMVTMGLPCVHFWATMLASPRVGFTLALLNPRWITNLQEALPGHFSYPRKWSMQQRMKVPIGFGECITPLIEIPLPRKQRGMSEVKSTRRMFADCMALTRRAFSSAAGDPSRVQELYSSLRKLQGNKATTQLKNESQETCYMENPLVTKPKGRPRGSRIPSSSENKKMKTSKNVGASAPNQEDPDPTRTGRICSNCDEVGHNRRTCNALCRHCKFNADGHVPKECPQK